MQDDDLEQRYREAREAFVQQYKIFYMVNQGTYKRSKLTPGDCNRLQEAWNYYLPLRKKFLGY